MKNELFGTDGIRSQVGVFPLDEASTINLGSILGILFQKSRILIGRDTRESSEFVESLLCRGLSGRANVFSIGVIPTPGLSYITREHGFDYGIMISASHNLYTDNGLKIFSRTGEKIPEKIEKEIEKLFRTQSHVLPQAPRVTPVDSSDDYRRFLLENGSGIGDEHFKIVLDCANGAASSYGPEMFGKLGFGTIPIHWLPNGRDINDQCGSTSPESLQERVIRERADLGIAFDGDADRAIFVDPQGRILDGEHSIFAISQLLAETEKNFNHVVVGTVMDNLGLEKALTDRGMIFTRTHVGDKFVYRKMKRTGAILGGEQCGHTILRNLQATGDGMLTAIFFLKALQRLKITAADICDSLKLFPQKLLSIPIRLKMEIKKWPALNQLIREFNERYGSDSRLLIRYSGTEPKIRIMIESRDPEVIDRQMEKFGSLIKSEIGV